MKRWSSLLALIVTLTIVGGLLSCKDEAPKPRPPIQPEIDGIRLILSGRVGARATRPHVDLECVVQNNSLEDMELLIPASTSQLVVVETITGKRIDLQEDTVLPAVLHEPLPAGGEVSFKAGVMFDASDLGENEAVRAWVILPTEVGTLTERILLE